MPRSAQEDFSEAATCACQQCKEEEKKKKRDEKHTRNGRRCLSADDSAAVVPQDGRDGAPHSSEPGRLFIVTIIRASVVAIVFLITAVGRGVTFRLV